jgi:hypothetical protein
MVERDRMKRLVDDHCFTIDVPYAAGPNRCRLQIFVRVGHRPVAVATQDLPPATGVSLTNGAERFAQRAWQVHLAQSPEPPRWIEHYTSGTPVWAEVLFDVDSEGRLTSPSWSASRKTTLSSSSARRSTPDAAIGTVPHPQSRRAQANLVSARHRRYPRLGRRRARIPDPSSRGHSQRLVAFRSGTFGARW